MCAGRAIGWAGWLDGLDGFACWWMMGMMGVDVAADEWPYAAFWCGPWVCVRRS